MLRLADIGTSPFILAPCLGFAARARAASMVLIQPVFSNALRLSHLQAMQ